MKRNTLKRILAGSLALLTVAAYFPANVGKGIVDTISLVASARDEAITADTTGVNLNDIEDGDYFENDTTLNKPSTGDDKNYTVTFAEVEFLLEDTTYANDDVAGLYQTATGGIYTIENVKKIEYTTMDTENNIKKFVLKITNVESGADHVYTVTMKKGTSTYAQFCENHFIRVKRDETKENGTVTDVTYTLGVEDVVDNVTLTYGSFYGTDNAIAAKYIQSITYTGLDGKAKTKTDISEGTNLIVPAKKNVTIKSTAMLKDDNKGSLSDYLTGYENGVFTYTFNAVDSRHLVAETTDFSFDLAKDDSVPPTPIAPEDKRNATIQISGSTDKINLADIADFTSGNPVPIPVGAKVTVSSPTSFEIKNGTIAGYENGEFTYEDVKGVYSDGVFKKEFVFSGQLNYDTDTTDDIDVDTTTVTLGAFPSTVEYTVSANKVTANDTDEQNPVIQNAQVAFVNATAYVPQYKDGAKTKDASDIKVDANGEKVFTETAIANNGNVTYDPDGNSRVDLKVVIDPALLGLSGTSQGDSTSAGKLYEAVVKKDGKVVATYTYKPKDTDNEFTMVDADSKTIASGDDYFIGDNGDYESFDGTGFTVGLKNAGKYEVALTVWSADNKAESKTANYTYTVKPATNVSEDDVQFYAYHKSDADQLADAEKKLADAEKELADAEEYLEAVISTGATNQQIEDARNNVDDARNKVDDAQSDIKTAQKNALKVTKNADGVYEVAVKEEDLAVKGNVTLDAYLKLDNEVNFTFSKGQILGIMETTQDAILTITDANYKINPITVNWKLVEAAVEDKIEFKAHTVGGYDTEKVNGEYSETAVSATFEKLETVVKTSLTSTNNVDVSNATFKFTKGEPLGEGTYDIDALNVGLPTVEALEENAKSWYEDGTGAYDSDEKDITFYIYATVGNLETDTPLKVTITKGDMHVNVNALLTKKQFTYGEIIEPEDIGFVNANGDVIEGITATKIDKSKITIIRTKDADGKKVTTNTEKAAENSIDSLTPGTYTAIINEDNAVTLSDDSSELYAYKTVEELFDTDNDAIVQRTKAITVEFTVAKKAIEPYMVNDINQNIVDGKAAVTDDTFSGQVIGVNNDPIEVTIVSGDSSETKPGVYEVTIKPVGDSAKRYTGTCKAKWNAVKADSFVGFGIAAIADNYNIYSDKNGVQIHAEAMLTDVDTNGKVKLDENNSPVALTEEQLKKINDGEAGSGKSSKITKFGMLVEKSGEFADYTNDDRAEVEKKFRYGYGYTQTNATLKASNGLRTGIGSVVSSIEDYVWIRPYAVTENGNIVYGNAERIDFTTVANKVIQPELSKAQLVQKNGSLYYYTYATKFTKTLDGDRTADPNAFGVVISRTGNYADIGAYINVGYLPIIINSAESDTIGTNLQKLNSTMKEHMLAQELTSVTYTDNDFIKDFIEVGATSKDLIREISALKDDENKSIFDKQMMAMVKAYLEEIEKVAVDLSLETCDVKSAAVANNANYTEDECGTLIRIADSTSNVYVKTYVDFGNGLVVYSEPQVIESASATLAQEMELCTFEDSTSNNGKYFMWADKSMANKKLVDALATFTTKKSKTQTFEDIVINIDGTDEEDVANQVTEFGLVIDKNGVTKGDKNLLVKGNGYLEIQSKEPNATKFKAVTNVNNKNASARAYVVYKGVAVYGVNACVNEGGTDNADNPYVA